MLKQQWSPDDLCKALGLSKSTLLLWESAGLIPKAKRKNLNRSRYWNDAEAKDISDYFFYRRVNSGR